MAGQHRADDPDAAAGAAAVPTGPATDAHGSTVAGAADLGPATIAPVPAASAVPPDPPRATGTRSEVVAAQQVRYGGRSWGSAFFGWLCANGVAVLLMAIASAAGVALGLTRGVTAAQVAGQAATIGLRGGIAALILLFVAYLAGGYVAGRMARFDGATQGLAVWVIGLVVVGVLALAGVAFGARYNVLARLNLPRIPIDEGTATTAGIVALVAVALATLLGAVLGGLLGVRYHRRVDKVGYDR